MVASRPGLLGATTALLASGAAAQAQARWYDRSRRALSPPPTDSVSALEAMWRGCTPLMSDLPANRELVDDGRNGLINADGALPSIDAMDSLIAFGNHIAAKSREWVREHTPFDPFVERLLARLQALQPAVAPP